MFLLTQLGAVAPCLAQGSAGGLRGVVYDAEFDGPVPEATVKIIELNARTNTVQDGHFVFGDVPSGSYTLTVSKPGYERFVQASVVVVAGSLADVTVRLKGEFTEMEELVVRDMDLADTSSEIGLLNLRGTTLALQDSISKELMSRAGAGDAASALRLVVGASVADGKYATVRGLSDRYVGTALNGIRVPSADPKKRSVHMDMFPSGTIESMSVSKTFTPDLPGDYTGGGVNIRTIGIPDKPFFKASVSREINRKFTDKPGYVTYEGSGVGRWGRDLGERDMPTGAEDMERDGLTSIGVSSKHDTLTDDENPHDEEHQAYDRIVKGMASAMGTTRTKVPFGNYGFTLSGGNRWDLGGGAAAGGTAAFTYSKKFSLQNATETVINVPQTNNPTDFTSLDYVSATGSEEVKWSMLGSIGLVHEDDHEVGLTFLRNRVATDRASVRIQEHAAKTLEWEQQQAIHYTERSMDVMQLTGKHRWDEWLGDLAGLELDWFAARNVVEQKEPDIRTFKNWVFAPDDGSGVYFYRQLLDPSGDKSERTLRLWRDTKEDNSQYGMHLAIPFGLPVPDAVWSLVNVGPQQEPWTQADGKLSMGFTRDFTRRWYRQESFYYNMAPQYSPTDPSDAAAFDAYRQDRAYGYYTNLNPEALWTDVFTDLERLGTGAYQNSMRWYVLPSEDDVNYEGDQNFHSGYGMLELPLTTRLRVSCGVRLEGTEIVIDPESERTGDPSRAYTVPMKNYPDPTNSNRYYYTMGPASENEAGASIRQADWLRSVGFVYDLPPDMKVRGTWSQTIARPTFLELAPVITYDFVSGENFVGNQDLKIAHIVNTDLRWEWFPSPGEVFAASLFHKTIKHPIERESFSYLGQDYLLAVNYAEGAVSGWEVEGRKKLDFLPDCFRYLSMGANYTLIDATVEVPASVEENLNQYGVGATTLGQSAREMEGQPTHLWNINVLLDIEPWGTSAGLFYSVRGDMLKSGAAIGERGATPNIYSKKLATVNLSFSQEFADRWKLTFQAKNLIDPRVDEVYRAPDGTEVLRRRYHEGVSYSFGLGATW
jgi:outer membrane receptor protein involved in Fe transport